MLSRFFILLLLASGCQEMEHGTTDASTGALTDASGNSGDSGGPYQDAAAPDGAIIDGGIICGVDASPTHVDAGPTDTDASIYCDSDAGTDAGADAGLIDAGLIDAGL